MQNNGERMSQVARISQLGKTAIRTISTKTNEYGQKYLPTIVVTGSRAIMQDAKWTTKYYKIKATRGWVDGRNISNKRHLSKPLSLITKTGYAIKEAIKNLQRKDVLPILGAGVGFFAPLLGGWILGFVAGKFLNQLGNSIAKGVKHLGKNLRHLR